MSSHLDGKNNPKLNTKCVCYTLYLFINKKREYKILLNNVISNAMSCRSFKNNIRIANNIIIDNETHQSTGNLKQRGINFISFLYQVSRSQHF